VTAQIDQDQAWAEEDQREPDGARVVLHAAALVLIGAVCHGFGAVSARVQGWVAGHVCDAESRWVDRSASYNQRAFRVIRPWWESAEQRARWRAERVARWRAERGEQP